MRRRVNPSCDHAEMGFKIATLFLKIMPVDPQGKVATTWGEIKFSR